MGIKIIKKQDYKTTKWSGGETTELFIFPEDANLSDRNFNYRISSATTTDEESVFSDFSGYDRYIMSLTNDLVLKYEGEDFKLEPFEIFYFDGSKNTISYSEVRDFNLILKKGLQGGLRVESLCEDCTLKTFNLSNAIIPVDGNIKVKYNNEEFTIEKFDTLFIGKNDEIEIVNNSGEYSRIIVVEMEV